MNFSVSTNGLGFRGSEVLSVLTVVRISLLTLLLLLMATGCWPEEATEFEAIIQRMMASSVLGRVRGFVMNQGKRNSAAITEGPSRAPARAMLKAVGFTDEDLRRPIIGVANTWTEIGPCNYHLRELAAGVKRGVREAGGTPMEFNT